MVQATLSTGIHNMRYNNQIILLGDRGTCVCKQLAQGCKWAKIRTCDVLIASPAP